MSESYICRRLSADRATVQCPVRRSALSPEPQPNNVTSTTRIFSHFSWSHFTGSLSLSLAHSLHNHTSTSCFQSRSSSAVVYIVTSCLCGLLPSFSGLFLSPEPSVSQCFACSFLCQPRQLFWRQSAPWL